MCEEIRYWYRAQGDQNATSETTPKSQRGQGAYDVRRGLIRGSEN